MPEQDTMPPRADSSAPSSPPNDVSGSNAGGSGQGIGAQIVSAAKDVVGDATEQAATLAGTAKDKAIDAAEGGKADAAGALDDVADALHKTADQLGGQQDWIAKIVDRGAAELGDLATTLRSNDLQGLLGKLQDLARREPAVFAGAAIAAGFAAARLGKVVVAGATTEDLPHLPERGNER